jgi:NADH dehydrogenase (ubiquinone) 1 alpha subcomplex subunit 5
MRCRITDLENKIGAGLIEEVIQVAEGELKLVDVMLNSKVYVQSITSMTEANLYYRWEDLEEKPVEGQWTYFMRGTATGTT